MPTRVRPARPADRAGPELLYVSAEPYYDAYAGSRRRAVRMLREIWPRPRHTASHDVAHVAERDGAVVGVLVAFPSDEGDALARRFLTLSIVRLPAWRWPGVVGHLRAAATVTPDPPPGALYVDALAVDPAARRQGVARTLLDAADGLARARRLTGVALDTGLGNADARALYEAAGFQAGGIREAPDERTARMVGGPGFVSYFKPI